MDWKACLAAHEKFEADPDALPSLCRRVANGEHRLDIVAELGLNLFTLNVWIQEDPVRAKLMQEAWASRVEWLKERRQLELEAIGFLDIRAVFTEDWRLKPVSEWPARLGAAVAGIDVEDMFDLVDAAAGHGKEKVLVGYLKKLKVWDKMKALDMLGPKEKDTGRIAESLEGLLAKSFEQCKP